LRRKTIQFPDQVLLEVIKTVFAFLTLVFAGIIGQRIIASWDIRKKRQQLDIEAAREFHKLYGEFKELSRLWRAYKYKRGDTSKKVEFSDNTPEELLKRAAAAEGGVEAIIAKLATERGELEDEEIRTLGLFRQAYQQLREAIRDDEPLEWTYGTREFTLYNDLASKTTRIISPSQTKWWRKKTEPPNILQQIAEIRPDDWKKAVNRLDSSPREGCVMNSPAQYFRAGIGALIVNSRGLILALERADISDAWQLPQGGLEASEEPLRAALREVGEETGISETDLERLDAYPEPLAYELPASARSEKTGRGQVQYWFLFRFHGIDNVIDVKSGGEFRSWQWMPFDSLLNSVADFRKPVYRRLAEQFRDYISKPRAADSNTG